MCCVVLFRQEIEMKQCSAYGEVKQLHELPDMPPVYELVGENDIINEKIPRDSQAFQTLFAYKVCNKYNAYIQFAQK